MTVKGAEPIPHGAGLEDQLTELIALMGCAMPALKRGGGAAPPAFIRAAQAVEEGAEGGHGALGPRHGPLLVAIALERDLSVSELAARVGLNLSTVSLMVGELSRAGLVERTEDERDRRRTLVRVHSDHAAEIEGWMAERIAPLRRTLERLSPDARAHFLEGWRVFADEAVAAAGGEGSAMDCDDV